MHKFNARLLKQVSAPQLVQNTWDDLEILRAGNVYGSRTNGIASAQARSHLKIVEDWASAPHP
jgi:hypothetical protein